jgi:DNA invertase Pin-like site-specific DNA recombinase
VQIIAYYRVSTAKQGKSGLGLDGQKTALETYAQQQGARIVAEYREVESGKRKDRPELTKALAHARRSKATLVVAKLDRLARNVAFLSALMDSGADFVACDNPHANRFTIHILAAVAEHEARQISERTRTALQAAKRRGVLLGSARPAHWKGREDARRQGGLKGAAAAAKAIAEAADGAYTDLYPLITGLRQQGETFQAIADELNRMGHTTRRGKAWNASQVLRVLRRAAA